MYDVIGQVHDKEKYTDVTLETNLDEFKWYLAVSDKEIITADDVIEFVGWPEKPGLTDLTSVLNEVLLEYNIPVDNLTTREVYGCDWLEEGLKEMLNGDYRGVD